MHVHIGHTFKQGHEEFTEYKGREVEVMNHLVDKDPKYRPFGDNDECSGIIADILEIVSSPDYGNDPGSPVAIAVSVGTITKVDVGEKILFCEAVLRRCLAVAWDSKVDIAECDCVIVTCTVQPKPEDLPPAPGFW